MKKVLAASIVGATLVVSGCKTVTSMSSVELMDTEKVTDRMLYSGYSWNDRDEKILTEMVIRKLVRPEYVPAVREGQPMPGMTISELKATCGPEAKVNVTNSRSGVDAFHYYYKGTFLGCHYLQYAYTKDGVVVSVKYR